VRGVDGVVLAAEFLSWWVSPRLVEEVIQALVTFPHAGPPSCPAQAAPRGQRAMTTGRVYVPFVLYRWLLVASCSLGLLSCTACGGSGKTIVPDLHGKTFGQSTKALADRGLCTPSKFTTYGSTPNHPTVVAQDPGPGARVDRGTHVTLTLQGRVSAGDAGDPLGLCSRQ
jgi:PASTA domain